MLRRLSSNGGPIGTAVQAAARKHGVSPSAVYNWLRDPRFQGVALPTADPPRRYEPTLEHLTVLAHYRSRTDAHAALKAGGIVDCSYATFARGLRERADPTLVAAALQGWDGLINHRLYLEQYGAPHRHHTAHLDELELDMWVFTDHRMREPVRPQVTSITDSRSGLVRFTPWKRTPNAEMFVAALADFAVEREYEGVTVGGTFQRIVYDNAKAHNAEAIREAIDRMHWVPDQTEYYCHWMNGRVEAVQGVLNRTLANVSPGATNAGTLRNGDSRHVARDPKKIDPGRTYGWGAFVKALREAERRINTEFRMKRLGGMTRLEAYAADRTARNPLTNDEAWSLMLRTTKTYRASKNGIHFDSEKYVTLEPGQVEFGRDYIVRYLPSNVDFIQIESLAGERVGTAYNVKDVTSDRKLRDVFQRTRIEQEHNARAIEAGVVAHRNHIAALANADAAQNEGGPIEYDEYSAGAEPLARVPARPPVRPKPTTQILASKYAQMMPEPGSRGRQHASQSPQSSTAPGSASDHYSEGRNVGSEAQKGRGA